MAGPVPGRSRRCDAPRQGCCPGCMVQIGDGIGAIGLGAMDGPVARNIAAAPVHHLRMLGSGQVGKTVNNLVHWGEIAVIVEALELGADLAVPAARLRQALF
jgi:3-hydroxyisobutyrate dehydrogenase-like beta-hydroxyacid dehydrogenase